LRRAVGWLALGPAAVGLGLGVAWAETALGIPKFFVQAGLLIMLVAVLGFAGWAAYGYYRAIRDEDDWD
jgi:hypothetical protein